MSESILNALMHLFAIIANLNEEGVSRKGKSIVEAYLYQHLSRENAMDFLKLFDDYVDFYKREEIDYADGGSIIVSTKPLERICQKIKKHLHRNERVIVLMRLLEFINEDDIITKEELEFVSIVAETFNISNSEFEDIKAFILEEHDKNIRDDNSLVLQSEEVDESEQLSGRWVEENRPDSLSDNRTLHKENLNGKIIFLYVQSIQAFAFTYYGQERLSLAGRDVNHGKFYFLHNGSILKGSRISPVYHTDISAYFLHSSKKTSIVFESRDLEFNFKRSKNGIKKFNFCEESGQLIAIMGGSGTGKSTLMNLLNGNLEPSRGKILVNGFDLYRDKFKLEGLIGYVPQDDLLFEELSVFENLYYNAKLCFRDYSEKNILDTVHRILDDLGLSEIRDLQVGSVLNKFISGGQRKRLNIALEIMREPAVLFVDEPTSGLSSSDSEMVMLLLKELTIKGKLVFCTIHQPSSEIFKMLDKLWVLDKGGYPIYNGNPIDAIEYFKTLSSHVNASESECHNCGTVKPEHILNIIESKEVDEFGKFTHQRKVSAKQWNESYQSKIETKLRRRAHGKRLPQVNFKIPDLDKQFYIFFLRNFLSKLPNKQYWMVNLLEAPLLAVILSYFTKYISGEMYVFSDNKNLPIFMFMSVVVALFMGLTVSAEEIIKDRKILKREAFLNLSRFSYLNSKIMFLFGLSAFQTICFVIVGHLILGIHSMVLYHWIMLFSVSCLANMVGLNISAGLNSVITIYILVPLIMVPQLLLGGAMIQFDDLHNSLTKKKYVPFIGDMMATRWAYEAIAVQQFKKNKFERHFFEFEQVMSQSTYYSTYLIPRLLNKLESVERNRDDLNKNTLIASQLLVISNELEKLAESANKPPFEYIQLLNTDQFSEEIAEELHGYLLFLRYHFQDNYQAASASKDSTYKVLVDSLGQEGFQQLQQKHHNKALADLVLNRTSIDKFLEIDNEIIQKKDPVFNAPGSKWGRAHFYAPVKNINGQLIDTFWFNLSALWVIIGLFYIALLTDALRKLITRIEKFKLSRLG